MGATGLGAGSGVKKAPLDVFEFMAQLFAWRAAGVQWHSVITI
jgi:hypothetical protein